MNGNLEADCREARLHFFEELCQQHGYQAVILGHHAGDLVETVFKRVLEGASLPYLCGLNEVTVIRNLMLWRPLLPFHKKDILEALNALHLSPFEDATNKDPKFLRGRLRTRIFPQLAREFGKEINTSLERIGARIQRTQRISDVSAKYELDSIESGPWGLFLDFTTCRTSASL